MREDTCQLGQSQEALFDIFQLHSTSAFFAVARVSYRGELVLTVSMPQCNWDGAKVPLDFNLQFVTLSTQYTLNV